MRIQDRLWPTTWFRGIFIRSTNGDHKNFNEYVRAAQLIKPITVKAAPASRNQADRVEKTNM